MCVRFFNMIAFFFFFFQAEDGIRDLTVTGVQTCALPIFDGALPMICPSAACSTSRRRRSEVDRKSTRLNSSHSQISYAVFCLKKKKINTSTLAQTHRYSHPRHPLPPSHYTRGIVRP